MKKFLRIWWALIVLVAAFFVIKTQTMRFGWAQLTTTEKWLASQTGDIFTLENLPYIQELTETSSGKLAEYIKNYVSTIWVLAKGDELCPQTDGGFYTWANFVCLDAMVIGYTTWFWNLWTWWDLNNTTPFMDHFNALLSSIWQISLKTFYISGTNNLSIQAKFNADPQTFQKLTKRISKDKNHVYCNDMVLEGDPKTFEIVSNTDTGWVIARDGDNYYQGCQVYYSTKGVTLSDLIPKATSTVPTEFSYTTQNDVAVVKSEISISRLWTAKDMAEYSTDCWINKPASYFDTLLSKFNNDNITQYNFLYVNKKPVWYAIDKEGNIGWRDWKWLGFVVSVLPNRVWYKTLNEVKKDFPICSAWASMSPILVNDKYILFVDGCGSGAWEPFACTEISDKIQKTIKLK